MNADPRVQEIKHAVGEAIAEWGAVEAMLGELMAIAINGDHATTLAAFHAVESSDAKLRMVDAALRQAIEQDDPLATWGELNGKARGLLAKRDQFVHWTVVWDSGRPLLRGQPGAFKAGFGTEFGGYSADDIQAARTDMIQLMKAISALGQRIEF